MRAASSGPSAAGRSRRSETLRVRGSAGGRLGSRAPAPGRLRPRERPAEWEQLPAPPGGPRPAARTDVPGGRRPRQPAERRCRRRGLAAVRGRRDALLWGRERRPPMGPSRRDFSFLVAPPPPKSTFCFCKNSFCNRSSLTAS